MRHTMMAAVCMTIAAAPALAQPQPAGLPQGLSLTETAEGTALAVGDKTVYRLILDRMRRRYKGFVSFDIASARCGEECTRYWAPLPPPAEFKATGNWTLVNADSKPQLAYKGDPLYIFRGRSFEPLMRSRTAPSYFSGYTAKPGLTLDGVPLGTIYWQPARYDRTAPQVATPGGVKVSWFKSAFLFLDAGDRKLYVRKSAGPCGGNCDGLTPFEAPMAAQALGDWRPIEDSNGAKVWTYLGKTVYFLANDQKQEPGAGWSALGTG